MNAAQPKLGISLFDKLRVAYTIYVRMGLRNIYNLRERQAAFCYMYEVNKERDPSVAEYCAQRCVELMKRRGGEELEK